MKDLIERLETATGPDRELDCAIYLALGATAPEGDSQYWTAPDRSSRHYESLIPRYTASIDAALRLVSEDVDVDVCRDLVRPAGKLWFAYLSAGDPKQTGFKPQDGRADTGALALCIAALKISLITAGQRGEP